MSYAIYTVMPRNRHFIRKAGPFHVGARTNNREWFDRPLHEVWEVSTDMLSFTARAFQLELHAFVLMNNHYHLLVSAPLGNLPEAMNYYQRELSKSMSRDTGKINHLFGGPYFASFISDNESLHSVYRYIYRNPVDAGIVDNVESYLFSSLRILMGQERSLLPIIDCLEFCRTPEQVLSWLNKPFHEEQRECIRKGLRHPEFAWKQSGTRHESRTDDLIYRGK